MTEDTLELVYYLLYGFAFAVSVLAFVMTNIQVLRFLIVLSSTAYAIYYYFYPAEPLWLDVGSELALVAVNGFMIVFLIWSSSRVKLDQREQFLYQTEFATLTRVEFHRLLRISEWRLVGAGHVFTVLGQPVDEILYLVSGHAKAELPDGASMELGHGNVIGEVSYRLNCEASATVTSTESCVCLCWNQDELRVLCSNNENIRLAVDNMLSTHMAQKLTASAAKPALQAGPAS